MRSLATALELPVGELLAKSGWTGAEEAFPSTDTQPAEQGHARPEEKREARGNNSLAPGGSDDEIQELRQEIVRLRETVELLRETIAQNAVALQDGAARRSA